MKTPKPSEEEMILHYYGESADPRAFDRALDADPELSARYERLRRELESLPAEEIPEPSSDLAARVWSRIRPELVPHQSIRRWVESLRSQLALRPGFALAAAATLALVAGIWIGRGAREAPSPDDLVAATAALSPEARERLLLASVSDHLGGSERLFASLANASLEDPADLADASRWAASLAASNRLYRTAAERSGQRRIVALLDELEPLLLELANVEDVSSEELAAAQRRIDDKDLLFKLRVAGERLDRSSRPAPRSVPTTTS